MSQTQTVASTSNRRIERLTLQNFRAFRGKHEFEIEGKNALIFGENGSGKTSLWAALDLFLAASLNKDEETSRAEFEKHRYQFDKGDGEVRLEITNEPKPFVWSDQETPFGNPDIIPAARLRACLDYRALWETYFLHRKQNQVDIWPLLIETIIPHLESPFLGVSFEANWFIINNLRKLPATLTDSQEKTISQGLTEFDAAWRDSLDPIKHTAREILKQLSPGLDFDWYIESPKIEKVPNRKQSVIKPPQVILHVSLYTNTFSNHHNLLNEARLSALALSTYLAAALINAKQARSGFRVLALDDVLIGLDMSNRVPVLKVLETFFSDWQVFLFTFDRTWYDIAEAQLDKNQWKKWEFYASDDVPIWSEAMEPIEKSRYYLQTADARMPDFKAAGVYARSAFESMLKRLCKKHGLPLPYKPNDSYELNELWTPIKSLKKEGPGTSRIPLIDAALITKIETAKTHHLNPLCHSQSINYDKTEVRMAIDVLEELKTILEGATRVGKT